MHIRLIILLVLALCLTAPVAGEVTMVPMRDGTKLATEVHLPNGEGPFPVVLVRSVYGRMPVVAGGFVGTGLAVVVQDTRGRGDSEGEDRLFLDDGWGAKQDGADTIDWIRAQSWCNGRIGTWGPSALSITQIRLAPATSHVSCQVLLAGASNFYEHLSYPGGVFRKSLLEKWTAVQGNSHVLTTWRAHPSNDGFWASYNADARAAQISAPGLHIGGWWDIFAQSTLDHFAQRQTAGAEGARGRQRLIMGPWTHGPARKAGDLQLPANYMYDFQTETIRFFAHWLKGAQNGIMSEPAVRYYTLGDVEDAEAPGNEWRTAGAWPPFAANQTAYYLQADGSLDRDRPTAGHAKHTFVYDPNHPCPTHGGPNLVIPAGPFDQRRLVARADVIVFSTPRLAQPVEITGRVSARLHVSSDAPDTDFVAKLIDIYPDGRQILMLDGIRRVKYRNGFAKPDPLPVGQIGTVDIDLWSISLIFNKGHRIGLHITSSNWPRFEKNPNTGDDFPSADNLRAAQNAVHTSAAHASALLLPVRP